MKWTIGLFKEDKDSLRDQLVRSKRVSRYEDAVNAIATHLVGVLGFTPNAANTIANQALTRAENDNVYSVATIPGWHVTVEPHSNLE